MGLEAAELARWTRFAAKGGIGKCTATCDCVAESSDDLMFLKDDEITVLYQIPDREGFFLGYCEGVVGRFAGTDVKFTTKLKKPVMTKRASVSASSVKSPSPSFSTSSTGGGTGPGDLNPLSPSNVAAAAPQPSSSSTGSSQTTVYNPPIRRTSSPRVEPLERRVSNQQPRTTSSLNHAYTTISSSSSLAASSSQQSQMAPSLSYSSAGSSQLSDDDVLGTPVFGVFPSLIPASKGARPSASPTPFGSTPSPREQQQFASPPTRAMSYSSSNPPSRVPTPSTPSLTNQQRYGQTSTPPYSPPQSPPPAPSPPSMTKPYSSPSASPLTHSTSLKSHKYTTHAPSPLTLYPESNTSPLRINKRSPTSPGYATLPLASPPPAGALPELPSPPPIPTPSPRPPPPAISNATSESAPLSLGASHGEAGQANTGPTLLAASQSSSIASSPLDLSFQTPTTANSTPMSSAYARRMSFSSSLPSSFPSVLSNPSIKLAAHEHDNDAARAGVSIGLSLLQDLADGMYSYSDSESESGSEYEDDRALSRRSMPATGGLDRLGRSLGGVAQEQTAADRENRAYEDALARVGHAKMGSMDGGYSEEGTMEGLGYARSEDTQHEHERREEERYADPQLRDQDKQAALTQGNQPQVSSTPNALLAFPGSPSSPTFPAPLQQQESERERRPSVAHSILSAHSTRSAASGASAASASSSSRWDAAAEDIYDDYRYSRFSMMSKAPSVMSNKTPSVMSGGSRAGVGSSRLRTESFGAVGGGTSGHGTDEEDHTAGFGAGKERQRADSGSVSGGERSGGENGLGGWRGLAAPQARPSIDSMMSWGAPGGSERRRRESSDSHGDVAMARPRDVTTSTGNLRQRPMGLALVGTELAALTESPQMEPRQLLDEDEGPRRAGDGGADVEGDGIDGESLQRTNSSTTKRTTMKSRTASVDSDASVYTQNSRLSTLSRDPIGFMESQTPPIHQHEDAIVPTPTTARPAPLNLDQDRSPLLHTSWGSAASSAGFPYPASPKSAEMYPTMAGVVEATGIGVEVHRPQEEEDDTNDDQVLVLPQRVLSPPLTPGFASAMRMRLEDERRSPNPEASEANISSEGSGLGHRIVIEDDEELPSRVGMDTTFESNSSEADTTFTLHPAVNTNRDSRASSSPSPEPELLALGHHLAPLVVTNRTPSPSIGEGASDDGGGLSAVNERSELLPMPAISQPSTSRGSSIAPSPSISPAPSPSLDLGAPPSHLRPSLADLRAPGGPAVPGTNQRRSLFLPHPNAPKAPDGAVTTGPLFLSTAATNGGIDSSQTAPRAAASQPYAQLQYQQQQRTGPPPPRPNVVGVIHMALSMPPRPAPIPIPMLQGPPGSRPPPPQMRGPTIYGRTETDLAAAIGPVPIVFSVEPPPRPTRAPTMTQQSQGQDQQQSYGSMSPPRMQMMSKPNTGQGQPPSSLQSQTQRQALPRSMSLGPGAVAGGLNVLPPSSAPAADTNLTSSISSISDHASADQKPVVGSVIPRANFFPKAPGMRPRSRSFSGFNNNAGGATADGRRTRDETELHSSKSSLSSLPGTSTTASTPSSSSKTSSVTPLRPSPLSIGLKPSISSPILKSPSSPLAQSMVIAPSPPDSSDNNKIFASDVAALSANQSQVASTERSPSRSHPSLRSTSSFTDPLPPPPFSPPAPTRTASLQLPPSSLPNITHDHNTVSPLQRDMDLVSVSSSDSRSRQVISPPPFASLPAAPTNVVRQTSLRSKLSLPNLRRKQSRPDVGPTEDIDMHHEREREKEIMLQVQDMEFELVRPNIGQHFGAARTSEDSAVLGRDTASLDLRADNGGGSGGAGTNSSFLRTDSPAFSVASGGGTWAGSSVSDQRSPTDSPWGNTPPNNTSPNLQSNSTVATPDVELNMDAHRQRELKWMSLMASNPASQARKSRKVRKLVLEGVPSSVRFLVWVYLTDGRGRAVPTVYSQLCSRGVGRIPAAVEARANRDIGEARDKFKEGESKHFEGGIKSSVGTLLMAYLNMVPDVQYAMGLTLIVGQLLLLSPEEDAFWIFVSVMDAHLRPYFSLISTQMEVDAALFSRALEANEPQIAKRLLVDVGLSPIAICQPWFSTLFIGALPAEYLNRVWDLFLFEGIPFLFRVGLALIGCLKRPLLAPMPLASSMSTANSTSSSTPLSHTDIILTILRYPPVSALPPSPEAFLALVFGVKVKDDDVRKQRVKMELQVKRQTAQQQQLQNQGSATSNASGRGAGSAGIISLPRSNQ